MALDTMVRIPAGGALLNAEVAVPADASGIVVFAHRAAGSPHRPRHRLVAAQLRQAGLATVLTDLLTRPEGQADQQGGMLRFDIRQLAERLGAVVAWLQRMSETSGLPVGLLGAGTCAAVAAYTAAEQPGAVRAVVCRDGLPNLAGPALPQVHAPTLLIVRGQDRTLLALNERAARAMLCQCELRVVPGGRNDPTDSRALRWTARWAVEWFTQHLRVR